MATFIGIDLGSHAVKLAIFEGSFGRYQLAEYRIRLVQPDASTAPDLDGRLHTLAEMVEELPERKAAGTAVGFPSEWASIRMVELPFGDRTKVENTLPFEVENQVPFDLEDMILVPRILRVGSDGSRVLCALAEKDRIRPLLGGLKKMGVDPRSLVLDADLLGDYSNHGVQAIIDVGHSRTLVSLCRGGSVISARAISSAGRDLTRALVERLGLSWADAEERKHAATLAPPSAAAVEWAEDDGLTDPSPRDLAVEEASGRLGPAPAAVPIAHKGPALPSEDQILREAISPLLAEIRSTLISFEDAHAVEVEEVLLCGGTAGLNGLSGWLSGLLGVPVRPLHFSDDAEMMGTPGRLALAHALAMKATRGGKGRILDLRRDEFEFRGDVAALGNFAWFGAIAAGFCLMAGIVYFGVNTYKLRGELAKLDEQIQSTVLSTFPEVDPAKVKEPSMALAIMREKTDATTRRVDVLGELVERRVPTLETVRQLSTNMPPPSEARIDINEMTIVHGNSIILKAETDGYEAAARIENGLKKFSRFKQAGRGDEKKRKDDVTFTITIPLGETSGEEG